MSRQAIEKIEQAFSASTKIANIYIDEMWTQDEEKAKTIHDILQAAFDLHKQALDDLREKPKELKILCRARQAGKMKAWLEEIKELAHTKITIYEPPTKEPDYKEPKASEITKELRDFGIQILTIGSLTDAQAKRLSELIADVCGRFDRLAAELKEYKNAE